VRLKVHAPERDGGGVGVAYSILSTYSFGLEVEKKYGTATGEHGAAGGPHWDAVTEVPSAKGVEPATSGATLMPVVINVPLG